MTTMQTGVLLEGQIFGFSGEWRLTASPATAVKVLSAIELGDTVIGLGAPLLTACNVKVEGLLPFTRRQGLHCMPETQQALWCFVSASDVSTLTDKVEQLRRQLGVAFELVQGANLFRYYDGRELSGHIDGTANKTGAEMVPLTDIAQGPFQHGTFALVQRYVYFDDVLARMTVLDKDMAFGRTTESNEEIEDAPDSAHIKRTDQDTADGGGDIIRRSMPFIAGTRKGTQFIAYTNDLKRIEIKLDRMAGLVDGVSDGILQFAQAETGAYYFCPAMTEIYLELSFLQQGVTAMTDTTDKTNDKKTEDQDYVAGAEVDIIFTSSRCIHSRHCVLDRPDVFVPNAKGEWIHPENANGEELAALARNCPSGAIRYKSHSAVKDEEAPLVNVVALRENGPYAVHADLHIAGFEPEFRATLCRCGQSQNKPYCDNSHIASGFQASGTAKPQAAPELAKRNGPVQVQPTTNGPLVFDGPIEIIQSTGGRITQTTKTALCRCGHSQNKPFCDGSHVKAHFRTD